MSAPPCRDVGSVLTEPLPRLVGAATAKKLAKLGLATGADLLTHYPRRYDTWGELTPIACLAEGADVTVQARVVAAQTRQMRARSGAILTVRISDGTDELTLTFFGKYPGALRPHSARLQPGATGLFAGTVSTYRGQRQLTHPDYQLLGDEVGEADARAWTQRPVPVYAATAGLPTWVIARAVGIVLDSLADAEVPEVLPPEVRAARGLPAARQALELIHRPATPADWQTGRRRAKFEEAFVLQTALAQARSAADAAEAPTFPPTPGPLAAALDARLPFPLTAGQRTVGEQIAADLARPTPMSRLLQGDVGAGKTVVALRAMLQVVDGGAQAVLLAPTEVLAAQHLRSLNELLGPLGNGGMLDGADHATRLVLLTGSQAARERRAALAEIAAGTAGIVVGTHALLSQNVQFSRLGLVVVDEQHRFGVEQRERLRERDTRGVHLLVMTATPIPRTIAMSVFGDLDVSVLPELPAGRQAVETFIAPATNETWVERVWQRVAEEVARGGRAFVVVPRIDDETNEEAPTELTPATEAGRVLTSVTSQVAQLRAHPALAGIKVGALHGRLASAEKDAAMRDFVAGVTPVLVATTVIEVGVDVPSASIMVICDADRFGISQLHQLRGRVGRGGGAAVCIAISAAPPGSLAAARLAAFAATSDGFALAETDLQLRSEGDVLGQTQSGRASSLRLLRVARDGDIIADAREAARALVATDPQLTRHPALAAALAARLTASSEANLHRS